MGLHSGEDYLAGDDYGGFEVNRAARIAAAGHGGQIVLSETTRALAADALPPGVGIRDLGRHTLRDLPRPEQVYQLDVPDLPTQFPALRTASATLGDLPARLTSFVGREKDLDALDELLSERRLVTLTGPGGIGKTSLAVESARIVADRFPDGAWFVSLADVDDPSTVGSVIARTIGLYDGPSRPAADALGPYLADRSVLLVLDNFEHLLDAVGDVAAILEASPSSRVLVTSRAPLRIAGEQEYPVDSLGDACARLFVERARAVRPGWEPGSESSVVDDVCTLVDRLPLGVELVAARVGHLPLSALRDRLAKHLPLPGSGPRNVPDRQRTLAGAIAWSHDLLPAASQRVLHDLAVFEGAFDLEQAHDVVEPSADGDDVLEHLVSLVDHSLVERDATEGGVGGIRFRLLETIRAFSLDQLRAAGREGATRRRHALAYLSLAETAAPNLPGPDQPRWLDRLSIDYPNLRAALRWAIDAGEVEVAQRFVAGLWRFWQVDGRLADATELSDDMLRMPGSDDPTPSRLAAVAAAGNIAYWHGRPTDAVRYYQEELAVARQLDNVAAQADAYWNLSFEHYIAGDLEGSVGVWERARDLFEQAGDDRGVARLDWSYLTVAKGDHPAPESKDELLALLARFERLGDTWFAGQTMMSLSWVDFAGGDVASASRWFVRAFAMAHALRDVTSTTIAIPLGALLAVQAGRPGDAATLLGAHDHLSELYGVKAPMGLSQLLNVSDPRGISAEMLGQEGFDEAFEAGKRMSLDDAVALVVRVQEETWGPS
jgi:predicted ATPase